ncbi:MAG: methyltransferase domain-containing protein [Acidobacteriota bacterium]
MPAARRQVTSIAILAFLIRCTVALSAGQAAGAATQAVERLTVTLPQDDAELEIDGAVRPGAGSVRVVPVPAVPPGTTTRHTITARWDPNTYTKMTRTKVVTRRAGEALAIDLSADDPTDRVRVLYVPTPDDVAEAMVRLARVTAGDVVYEPGCGDARITIAAVKAGAARGLCVDLDPERAAESTAKVREAGLSGRIEVREGDALDVKDLSGVTVVFLYMGDHFNHLIRPVLWKQLPIGARVVSHRFTMGDDWAPDETVTVDSVEGGDFELHLWMIRPEHKGRSGPFRAARRGDGASSDS